MNDIKEELERIAGTAGPAPGIDIAAAAAKGRRIRRARRAAVAATTAGAVAAAVVFVPLPDRERAADVASAYPAPLVARASFGWLPDGFKQTQLEENDHGARSFSMIATRAGAQPGIHLTVHGRGSQPRMAVPVGQKVHRTPAAPVNGRPAHWTIEPGSPAIGQVSADFRWEYEEGRWAQLQISDPRAATVETVRRIAAATRFADREVAFPLRVQGIPAGFKLYRVVLGTGPMVQFRLRDPNGRQGDDLSIAMLVRARVMPDMPPKTTTEDAYLGLKSGYYLRFNARGEALRRVEGQAGLRRLFEQTSIFADTPSRWTTRPLD